MHARIPAHPEASSPVLLAEVTRGPVVESRHFGHAVVVDTEGTVRAALGDATRLTLPRSAVKPIQALPTLALGAADRFRLGASEIAVMCASHAAEPFHLAAVRSILARIGASEDDLHCGPHPPGDPETAAALVRGGFSPAPIHNNCSGKHAGMLVLARLLDAPLVGYWEPDHPAQRAIQRALMLTSGLDLQALAWGTDGCGVPTYLLSLRQLATGFAHMANPDLLPAAERSAARAIADAVNERPEMVSGTNGFCTALLRAAGGRLLAKGGAEGCYAVGIRDRGVGIAVKMEDGSPRAVPAVVTALLRQMDVLDRSACAALERFCHPVLQNTRGDAIGEIRAVARVERDLLAPLPAATV
jgi:L-asparaginase II